MTEEEFSQHPAYSEEDLEIKNNEELTKAKDKAGVTSEEDSLLRAKNFAEATKDEELLSRASEKYRELFRKSLEQKIEDLTGQIIEASKDNNILLINQISASLKDITDELLDLDSMVIVPEKTKPLEEKVNVVESQTDPQVRQEISQFITIIRSHELYSHLLEQRRNKLKPDGIRKLLHKEPDNEALIRGLEGYDASFRELCLQASLEYRPELCSPDIKKHFDQYYKVFNKVLDVLNNHPEKKFTQDEELDKLIVDTDKSRKELAQQIYNEGLVPSLEWGCLVAELWFIDQNKNYSSGKVIDYIELRELHRAYIVEQNSKNISTRIRNP